MKDKLLDRDKVREMMDVRTLPEVIEMLEESPYKKHFVRASTKHSGVELVRKALDSNLVESFRKVWEFAPAKAKPVIAILLQQWEINNLKKALASKALGRKPTMDDFIVLPGPGEVLLSKIVENEGGLEDLSKILDNTEYGQVYHKALGEYKKSGDFRVMLSALDDYYFRVLSRSVFSGGLDDLTRNFLSRKLDYAAVIAILRMKQSGVQPSEMRKYLVYAGVRQQMLEKMISASSVPAAVELMAGDVFVDPAVLKAKADAKDIAAIELELEKALLKLARKTLSRSVLSLGALVGFLFLKQEEVHSIRKIAYATQFEVKQDLRDAVLAAV